MHPRRAFSLAALFLAVPLLAALPAAAQIINGGFEAPSDEPPLLGQWRYVAGALRDATNPHSGAFAANLNNLAEVANVNVQQQTPAGSILPGTQYALSYWAQADYGVSGVGQVQLAFLNADGNILPGSPQFINIPASAAYAAYSQNFLAPPNASALFLGFNAVTGAVAGATSHVYVDDVTFTSASPFAPADFNHDTFVDGLDLQDWRAAYAQTSAADADGDNDSDGADFLLWQRTVGPPAVAAVPEPATPALTFAALALAALGLPGRRTRRPRWK